MVVGMSCSLFRNSLKLHNFTRQACVSHKLQVRLQSTAEDAVEGKAGIEDEGLFISHQTHL